MWTVYMLRLSDNSLYCGITKDLERRMKEHRQGRGSKYVKGRLPFDLVYTEKQETRKKAMQRESQIKNWSKKRKEKLVKN